MSLINYKFSPTKDNGRFCKSKKCRFCKKQYINKLNFHNHEQNCDNYCESVTKILLQFGADPNIKDKNGNSCFEHAKNLINNRIFEGIETQTINNGVLRVLK